MTTEQEIEKAVLNSRLVITLSVREVNQLLSIVGRYPFDEVQGLVRRITEEGQPQVTATIAKLKAEAEATEIQST